MRIVIADDHPVVLMGISGFLMAKKHTVVATSGNGIEAWNSIILHKPDVALLDHNMPGMSGIEIAMKVHAARLRTKVVLLTMYKEKALLDKAIAVGVNGYLLKDFALGEIDQCLQSIVNGTNYYSKELTKHILVGKADGNSEMEKLTVTEQKVMNIIAEQKTSNEIADMLFISVKTVEKHRSNIIKKLGLPQTPNSIALWAAKNIKDK
ncbi:MAG: response regulator transcription factor [Flavipsychrobacter sp.]|nr:response regulator transcription factor [Flavipsychrobacter sp.]